jgi:hypothetical protein
MGQRGFHFWSSAARDSCIPSAFIKAEQLDLTSSFKMTEHFAFVDYQRFQEV